MKFVEVSTVDGLVLVLASLGSIRAHIHDFLTDVSELHTGTSYAPPASACAVLAMGQSYVSTAPQ